MKNHFSRFGIFLILLMALLMTVSSAGASTKDAPIVTLSATQSEYRSSQDVIINVYISNPTNHTIRILKWFTPNDGLEEAVFAVKVNGESVHYTGAVYKRPAPTGNDYISLNSGESITYTVNLGDYYDLSETGKYEIYYDATSYLLYDEKGNNSAAPDSLLSEVIHFKIEGRPEKKKPTPQPTPAPGGTTFNACTTTQQAILINARTEAKKYAAGAENYLLGINSGTPRYLEWFGLFTASRYDIAKTHFTSISDAWDNAGVNFDCKCKQNYYAYVYPDRPYYIYLCKVFWQAPLTGTDSQAGTLIHEMSHFYDVASTEDYVYGQAGARNLAITNPDNAVMNADNHEYFAENNPPLQ